VTKVKPKKGENTLKCFIVVLIISIFTLLVVQQGRAEGRVWGDDVLVHQASHIYGFGMDQADKDTLLLVVSDSSTTSLKDTLYIYSSTNNGQIWNCVDSLCSAADNQRFGKIDIIAAKGYETYEDSDFVFVFFINNRQLCCARYPYDLSSVAILDTISDAGENVVDFAVCEILRANCYLGMAYQTDEDSVIFKRSTNYGKTWTQRKNLAPIASQPSIAWNRGYYLVVAGKTADDRIYAIRTTVSPPSWTDGGYLGGSDSCAHPVLAASHTTPSAGAYFWIFYQRWNYSANPPYWVLDYHYGQGGANWSLATTLSDSSRCPSLHVLKDLDASNITLAYRYEDQIRYIYRENQQDTPSVWPISSSGVNTHDSDTLPPQRAYTIRGTDNTVMAAVLYVSFPDEGLYFNASSFTGIEDEVGIGTMKGFTLGQNYPNPFNPSTTIEYSLDSDEKVEIVVYNISGQKVKTLFDGYNSRGTHRVVWDGTDEDRNPVASGVYFYKMKSKDQTQTKKLVLTK
jgi:hypothetical protein